MRLARITARRLAMATIDIIMPVYNTPSALLQRCLDGIKAQTCSDWRLLVIDDGSSAQTAGELDRYAGEDDRITVIHQSNQGVSSARNAGLDLVQAPFVAFCDSDDLFHPSFLSGALEAMKNCDADIYVGSCQTVRDGQGVKAHQAQEGLHVFRGKEQMRLLMDYAMSATHSDGTSALGTAYVARLYPKLFRREIVQEIRMNPAVRISEDSLFAFDAYARCESVVVDSTLVYSINVLPNSLSRGKDPATAYRDLEDLLNAFSLSGDRWCAMDLGNAYRMRLLMIFSNMHAAIARMRLPLRDKWRRYAGLASLSPFRSELARLNLSSYLVKHRLQKRVILAALRLPGPVCTLCLLLDGLLVRFYSR